MTLRRWPLVLVGALAIVALWLHMLFRQDMGQAYQRVQGRSSLMQAPQGAIEFKQGGSGPPVLVVHGSGGGFDQGEMIAAAVLGEGWRWIAPSRFGYLRSTFQEGAGFDDQARAYAHLLDHLGIRQVAVVALSHGGPSALWFALLHPERVSSLTLISCGVAAPAQPDPDQAQAHRKGSALMTIFSHDILYWGMATLLRQPLLKLMGADDAVIAGLSADQRRLVDRLIDEMNPVAPRAAGAAFDNRAAMPDQRIAGIRVPTLILHARDDGLQLFRNAEFAAATIPGSRLMRFDKGGHLLLAVEQARVQQAVQTFIRAHLAP